MDHFFIITNAYKDKDHQLASHMKDYIESKGGQCSFFAGEEEAGDFLLPSSGDIPEGTQVVFVLGGDGTLIRAARAAAQKQIPMIGVNLGHLGYLCELEGEQVFYAIDRMMQENYIIEERMMLSGRICKTDAPENAALNDIVISRSRGLSIIQLILYVNGEYLNTYRADGIIIATPTGSTGYSMSAGGPIIEPKAEMILLTPINAHELNAKSIVLGAEDEITIEIGARRCERDERVEVHFDGDRAVELGVGDKITIQAAPMKTKILKLSKISFLEIIRRKMQVYS